MIAAGVSGDPERIHRAYMRMRRNQLRALWRRDPREPGRTIILIPRDEESCRTWALRHGFRLDALDWEFPAFSDACRWTWARMSRGLIGDTDLRQKVNQLRNRIMEASGDLDRQG